MTLAMVDSFISGVPMIAASYAIWISGLLVLLLLSFGTWTLVRVGANERRRRAADIERRLDAERAWSEAAAARRAHREAAETARFAQPREQRSSDPRVDTARRLLGVSTTASERDIVLAHRTLMRRAHPDLGGTTEAATSINEARNILLKALRSPAR